MNRLVAYAVLLVACGGPVTDPLVGIDASPDAPDGAAFDAGPDADPTLGGPCTDDGQCDDQIACTHDSCDQTLLRCRNVPDDTLCDDGVYCNGKEVCKKSGCAPGPVVACSTGDACDIDSCVEAQKTCTQTLRDVDGDGDGDDHCAGGHDCDDANPAVSSLHSEICNNGVDDNCNGQVDEQPCVVAQNATCNAALPIAAPGTYGLSTVGAPKSFSASCSVSNPPAAHDVVAAVTVPAGPNVDLDVWAEGTSGETAVAIFSACNQPASELACGPSFGASATRARARGVAPGTYFVVVTSSIESSVELSVDFLSPTPRAANEDCASDAAIATNTPTTVSLIDAAKDLPDACGAQTGELTYAITLAQPSDVRVYGSTLRGSGTPVLGLRAPSCTGASDELRCRNGPSLPLFARGLQGSYVLTVAGTSLIDASVLVETSPPTTAPADQSCATSPSATIGGAMNFDLSNHEDSIQDGCFAGGPTASYDVALANPSDVLVVGRFPQTEIGAVSFDAPGCTSSDRLLCGSSSTPVRVSQRAVPAGDYRVVVSDENGLQGTLTTLVRDTVPATQVTSGDNCFNVVDIPSTGGFFYGDTTGMTADFDESCDYGGVSAGGASDQILRLVLAQSQRVVLDMNGSTYSTILSLRQGATCPGTELVGACNFAFSGPRSFLDEELTAGTYYIVIDGYDLAKGPWDLDVRVIAP
ncbi:MAG TPA: putative metal-binding motif-containing protein [Polyangiaceae bacterium]|jgi:hypothetical protein